MTKVAFLFPGQGAQYVGMGREFYEACPLSKNIFDKANNIISGLTDVIFNGPAEKLVSTAYCQPAIFTFSTAALKALQVHSKFSQISPAYACGLSLGEYSALAACGALSFEETLKLVERRSFFMEEAAQLKKGTMAAIIGFPLPVRPAGATGGSASGADKNKLLEICQQAGAEVANFNSPEQIVITGEADKVNEACRLIKEAGAKRVIPLEVSGAFHSSLMQPAAVKFEEELKKANLQAPEFPIISNVDGLPANNPSYIRKNLAKQITSPVQWVNTIEYIASRGIKDFIEIGPGSVLKGLIRRINPELKVYNIEKPQDIEALP